MEAALLLWVIIILTLALVGYLSIDIIREIVHEHFK